MVGRGQEAEEERAIHAASSTREEKQRDARLHWLGGGRGGTCHTSCSIFHKRGETAPCEITLVGRGQEAEEGRFFIIVATIILSDLN
jgi:hypothetical protein